MNLTVNEQAFNWYVEELALQSGDSIRFYVRYGGFSTFQPGLSLGISKDTPENPIAIYSKKDITFFIEHDDEWYFKNHSLSVTFSERLNEPEFEYIK
ncbi:HesB/YadR/YfhF family protein [Bacillus timonensis]|nr:HesB/YadR/YfhF family protein [Bacillus timonensis]